MDIILYINFVKMFTSYLNWNIVITKLIMEKTQNIAK